MRRITMPQDLARQVTAINKLADRCSVVLTDDKMEACIRAAAILAGVALPERLTLMPLMEASEKRYHEFLVYLFSALSTVFDWPAEAVVDLYDIMEDSELATL